MSHREAHDVREEGGGHVHAPQYSYAPIIVGTGIFLALLYFVFGPGPAILGLILFVAGVALWIKEDIGYYGRGGGAEH